MKVQVIEQETPSRTEENPAQKDKIKDAQFAPGTSLKLVRVRFPGNAKSFAFLAGKRRYFHGQKVVAHSDRGIAVGYINSFPYEIKYKKEMGQFRNISRIASDEDIQKEVDLTKTQQEAKALCRDLIISHKLEMNLTHVEYIQFGKKVVFYFTASSRIDFRQLVRELSKELKLRVELRQISTRDRSAALGGIGPCGRELCCSSFLGEYGNISIKMAKNQNLVLNFSRLNGVCGQLKCCLKYENDIYTLKRKKLPKIKSIVRLPSEKYGKVLRLHVLSEKFDALSEKGVIRRYSIDDFDPEHKAPKDYKFPEKFEHITDESRMPSSDK